MLSAEFTRHIRFALQHLYEINVLEAGPARALESWLKQLNPLPPEAQPGQQLHNLLMSAIDGMKPRDLIDSALPAHRHYLILKRRYLDRIPIALLESEFSSSSRQFRRDNHRAIEELVAVLGRAPDRAPAETSAASDGYTAGRAAAPEPPGDFDRHILPVNLWELITEASKTLAPVISSARIAVRIDIPPEPPVVDADRVALRLALIKLLRVGIAHCPGESLTLAMAAQAGTVEVSLSGVVDIPASDLAYHEATRLFALAGGRLHLLADKADRAQRLVVTLNIHRRPVVLVVDDDPAMPRIIERYLALQPVQVAGCKSTDNVLGMARELRPILILLDILMPGRDGWEVLQELKADPETYSLNVAVCSIWDEGDLALTLGADAFFQKPIDRAALLAQLQPFLSPLPSPPPCPLPSPIPSPPPTRSANTALSRADGAVRRG